MSKKQELAVLDKATVSNNINLNINQNDLVELAIAEHMARIEAHLQNVREKLAGVRVALEKSEEGQGILKMLSSVANVKLLK